MNEIIEKAVKILTPFAEKEPLEDIVYEVRVSDERYKLSLDNMESTGSCESFCKNCIEDAIKEYKKWWWKRRVEKFEKFEKVKKEEEKEYYRYEGDLKAKRAMQRQIEQGEKRLNRKFRKGTLFSSVSYDVNGSERDSFEFCEDCGIMFFQCLLLDEQELQHWESYLDVEFFNIIKDKCTRSAYELRKVFECYNDGCNELDERLEKLAVRFLNIMKGVKI